MTLVMTTATTSVIMINLLLRLTTMRIRGTSCHRSDGACSLARSGFGPHAAGRPGNASHHTVSVLLPALAPPMAPRVEFPTKARDNVVHVVEKGVMYRRRASVKSMIQ